MAEFRILGPLEVRLSGKPVRVPGIRQQKLLVLLLLEVNRVVTTDRLVDELWTTPPRSVRQQVHNAVASLRSALTAPGEDVQIVTTDVGYRLDTPADSVDAHVFRRLMDESLAAESSESPHEAIRLLESALNLWRGEALAGLNGTTIGNAGLSLTERHLTATERLLSLRLKAGEGASLVDELSRLVAEHPMRQGPRGHLMLALHRSGRQPEALAVYDEGRRLVVDELGLEPSSQLRQLHLSILKGDLPTDLALPEQQVPEHSVEEEQRHHVPERKAARSYLPHDIRDFSGRSKEIGQLIAETKETLPTALVITAIDGMGGVGKTTLAVRIGHQVTKDYPDGQYFIDLHGFSPGLDPVTPLQALDNLLRDSGVPPELVPHDMEGRSAMWRSEMADRRALLLLDNAIDAAHVRPLLPGTAGVLVVVTSRRKLTALEGAVPLSLDVLPQDDAVELFARVVGTKRLVGQEGVVAQAVELCGRLPLAIRIAAARLRDRTSWTVADLVDRLDDDVRRAQFLQAGDRSVLTVLKLSYRYLLEPQQRVFRLLGLHPGSDFEPSSVAALTALPPEEAERYLEALFDDNLLKQSISGRFYFHDLVRDAARQILFEVDAEPERRDAIRRLLDHYVHAAHSWSRELNNRLYQLPPKGIGKLDPLPGAGFEQRGARMLDSEFLNLVTAVRFAAEHGWDEHAWQLACFLQPSLRDRNYGNGAAEVFEHGLRAARRSGDARGQAACLQGLAAVHREHGSPVEAMTYLEEALALGREFGDPCDKAAQLVELGNLYLVEDRLEDAAGVLRDAANLTGLDRDDMLSGAISNNLGLICRDLGRYDEALEHLERALASKSADHFLYARSFTAWSVAAVHHFQGDHIRALQGFEEILRRSMEAGFEHGEAVALLGLSAVKRSTGHFDESLALGRRSLTLARKLRLPLLECEVLDAIGETTLAMGDLDQAELVYRLAEDYARDHSARRYQARTLEGLAHIALRRGDTEAAASLWETAISLYAPGMADADYVRRHLEALHDSGATCFRCLVVTGTG